MALIPKLLEIGVKALKKVKISSVEKTVAKEAEHAAEKTTVKAAEKTAAKVAEKTTVNATGHAAEKTAAEVAKKTTAKGAEKSVSEAGEKAVEEASKPSRMQRFKDFFSRGGKESKVAEGAVKGTAMSSAKMGSHEVAAAKEAYARRAIESIGNPSYKVEGVVMPNRFSYSSGMFIDAKRARVFNIQEFGRLQSRFRSLYGSARNGYLSFEKSLPKSQGIVFNKVIPNGAVQSSKSGWWQRFKDFFSRGGKESKAADGVVKGASAATNVAEHAAEKTTAKVAEKTTAKVAEKTAAETGEKVTQKGVEGGAKTTENVASEAAKKEAATAKKVAEEGAKGTEKTATKTGEKVTQKGVEGGAKTTEKVASEAAKKEAATAKKVAEEGAKGTEKTATKTGEKVADEAAEKIEQAATKKTAGGWNKLFTYDETRKNIGSMAKHPISFGLLGLLLYSKLTGQGMITAASSMVTNDNGLANELGTAALGKDKYLALSDELSKAYAKIKVLGSKGGQETADAYDDVKDVVRKVMNEMGDGYQWAKNRASTAMNGQVQDEQGQYVDPTVQQFEAVNNYLQEHPEMAAMMNQNPKLFEALMQNSQGGGVSQISNSVGTGINELMGGISGGNVHKMDIASLMLSAFLGFSRFGLIGKVASLFLAGNTLHNMNVRNNTQPVQQTNVQQLLNEYNRQLQQSQQRQQPVASEETPAVHYRL